RTVEMTVGGEDRSAKALDQALEGRLPGLDHLACNLVAVQDRHTECAEELCGGGLATGDAARQTHAEGTCAHSVASGVRCEETKVGSNQLTPEHQHEPASRGEKGAKRDRHRAVMSANRDHQQT